MLLDLSQPKHAHIDRRLRTEPIIWLGSVRPDGRPHLVPVWFLWDGTTITIYSQPKAQKIRNLQANPHITLALEALDEGGDIAIFGGEATLPDIGDKTTLLAAYAAKYSAGIAELGMNPESMAASYSQPIQVAPGRLITW